MITQKNKPNKEKLKISNITIDTKQLNPKFAEQKSTFIKNYPTVYYYGIELQPQTVKKLIIDTNKFLPLCYIAVLDTNKVLSDIGFPTDNAKISIVLPSNHDALANIFMDFKIQKYEIELVRGSTVKKIHMWGICNVENLLIPEYKSYPKISSYDLLNNVAQDSGLGFMSNCSSSSDSMTWLNPGIHNYEFLQDTANKAWVGDSGFIWSFVDLFYNINYINVETALSEDIKNIKWVNTSIVNNNLITNTQNNQIISPILTNESSQKGSNTYFSGEKILNQSTDISLKRGYLRNVYFYDIDGNWSKKGGAYKKYGLDTITSTGSSNNSIFLKGEPGSTDFYTKNITNHYLDKIDTSNMFSDFLWAKLQNSENLIDLQKITLQITLSTPNFNIKRFENIQLVYTTPDVGINAIARSVKLNGEWFVTGYKFEWNGSIMYQIVNLVKRELTVGDI